jgi:hypothetical protein
MGIAEIQAAFAAQSAPAPSAANPFAPAPAPAPFAAQLPQTSPAPAVAQATAFQPSAPAPNPFAAAAPLAFQPTAPAPFAFIPPAGFVPASAPPINPVGERQSLNTAEPVVEAPSVVAPVEPEPAPKGRRTRKSTAADKALAADKARSEQMVINGDDMVSSEAVRNIETGIDTIVGALTTEQLCDFLTARGYSVRLER